jgi:hypothetical protein
MFQIIIETINGKMFWIATQSKTARNNGLENKVSSNLVVISLVIFLVIHLIISVYKDSNYINWNLKATLLGSGLFWFLLGNYIACKKDYIVNHLSDRKFFLYLAVFISGALAVTLNYFTPNFSEFAIIPYSTLLFLLAIKNPTVHINKTLEFIGDKLSLNVYILHIIIAKILGVIILKLGFDQNNIYIFVRPIVVIFFTLLVSWILYKIQNYMFPFGNKNTYSQQQ